MWTLQLRIWKKRRTNSYNSACKGGKMCESCKVNFPKKNPKIGCDLVVIHKERYTRPNFHRFGKRGEPILTTQFGRKFYCVKKECSWNEIPIYWKGRFFMWISLSAKLLLGHDEYLKYELCPPPICNPCPNLKSLLHRFVIKLAKFLFLAVWLITVGKLCRSSYWMYIYLNSFETILKQNME